MDGGQWSQASRAEYNLIDAVARSTVQVSVLFNIRIKLMNLLIKWIQLPLA